MKLYLIVFLCFLFLIARARNDKLIAYAVRTDQIISIDGKLNEPIWQAMTGITNFVQYEPYNGSSPTFQTEVRIAYDNTSIYFAILCYDSSSDSILCQLGDRDQDVNADDILIQFDPFGNYQDAYNFRLTASNVQSEWRRLDHSFYAIWYSKTYITEWGWIAEIQIPFSSIRIPAVQQHKWLFQVTRNIRRYREISKWAPEHKGVDNNMIFWGVLVGLENIKHSIQLFFRPYTSIYTEINEQKSWSLKNVYPITGIDLKYGLNESFTLDMTLLPDFSQVRSDDIIMNLSAFETYYSEQRPFFNENMDIFKNGGILYTRRFGKIPSKYNYVENILSSNQKLLENPANVPLLNAIKFSGQTYSGNALGFLNVLTNATYAIIFDSAKNETIKFETEPLTNYNVIVFRKALPNNSNFYLINGNVLRNGNWPDANVTGAGTRLLDKSNKYALALSSVLSKKELRDIDDIYSSKSGLMLNVSAGKVRGNLVYGYNYQTKNAHYDINYIGLNFTNDENHHSAYLSYRIFSPFWKLLRLHNTLSTHYTEKISSNNPTSNGISYSISTTTLRHLSMWASLSTQFTKNYDFYEPRTPGYFIIWPRNTFALHTGISSDYRKPLAIDAAFSMSSTNEISNDYFSYWISPIIRVSNHFQFSIRNSQSWNSNSLGFAGRSIDIPTFGKRDVYVVENSFNGKYIFRNNLSLFFRLRHYITQVLYKKFYLLSPDGFLYYSDNISQFDNLQFHSFQMDMIFYWEFAAGSSLNITWKSTLVEEKNLLQNGYFQIVSNLFSLPIVHYLNIKIIYFIDYGKFKSLVIRNNK